MSSDTLVVQAQALASLYTERLEGTQIRLLRLLPSETCADCGRYHDDDSDSDSNESESECAEDCECGCENCDRKVKTDDNGDDVESHHSSESYQHKSCRDEGCNGCDLIRIELITVRLEDVVGKFDALSYVWGWADVKEDVKVNGTRAYITINLELALRRLRNTEKAELLWVDALCINQTDVEEKNKQVMRMKEIYAVSRKVFVWMGEEIMDEANEGKRVHDARVAIKMLGDIYQIAKDTKLKTRPDPYQMFAEDQLPYEEPSTLGLPKSDAPEWKSLKVYLRRPWFSRVWIIQEVAAAKEAIVIVGDDIMIPWAELAVAAIWLLWRGFSDNMDELDTLWNILTIDVCRKHAAVPLLRRLSPTAAFKSTMQHDKIYALPGTTFEGRRLEKYPRLRIDYRRDWRELFREVVRHCIETRGQFGKRRMLHVLSQVKHEKKDGKFQWNQQQSSWVPDWDEAHVHCPIAWRHHAQSFTTTREADTVMVDSGDSRILSLKGVCVDKIAKTYTNIRDVQNHDLTGFSLEEFHAVVKIWSSIRLSLKIAYHEKYPYLADAFARTLTAAGVSQLSDSNATTGAYFAAYYETGLLFSEGEPGYTRAIGSSPQGDGIKVFDDKINQLPETERHEAVAHMMNNFRVAIDVDRVFFVTEKGYIGTGPDVLEIGDEVCVLWGGLTPFLIRPVKRGHDCPEWLDLDEQKIESTFGKLKLNVKTWLPGKKVETENGRGTFSHEKAAGSLPTVLPRTDVFRLVGECYVDGLMEGEAMDAMDKGSLEEKTIHLV